MVMVRKYKDYDEYVAHQTEKLGNIYPILTSGNYRENTILIYKAVFKLIIKYALKRKTGGKLLCLGARLGEEVEAWRELGFDATGIDLNPGPDNKFVTKGDFHDLDFKEKSFNYVFSNAIDHVLYIDQFNKECHRVLKKGGRAFFEVRPHLPESVHDDIKKKGIYAGNRWYESFYWHTQAELIDLFVGSKLWKGAEYHDLKLYDREGTYSNPRPFLVLTK